MQHQLPNELASLKELVPPTIPGVGEFFDVNVTLAASPSNFTVQSWSDGQALDMLQREMNHQYTMTTTQVDRKALRSDSYFAGRHTDGFWYRVRVNSQVDDATVAVRLVDYGDYSLMSLENLAILSSRFRNLPMQAINASLAGEHSCVVRTLFLTYGVLVWYIRSISNVCLRHHPCERRLDCSRRGLVFRPRGGPPIRGIDQDHLLGGGGRHHQDRSLSD